MHCFLSSPVLVSCFEKMGGSSNLSFCKEVFFSKEEQDEIYFMHVPVSKCFYDVIYQSCMSGH